MKKGTKNIIYNPLENEIWKPVFGFDGLYEVSNKQRVKSFKRNKNGLPIPIILRNGIHKFGYPSFTLCKNGKPYYFQLHRLVAEAFIPNPYNLPCINHIDCNPLNNNIDNLEWCTHSHNSRHAYITGRLDKSGEKNSMSKLTEVQVIDIFNYNGKSKDLILKYGIVQQTISDIKTGRRWGWLTGKHNPTIKKRLKDLYTNKINE